MSTCNLLSVMCGSNWQLVVCDDEIINFQEINKLTTYVYKIEIYSVIREVVVCLKRGDCGGILTLLY